MLPVPPHVGEDYYAEMVPQAYMFLMAACGMIGFGVGWFMCCFHRDVVLPQRTEKRRLF